MGFRQFVEQLARKSRISGYVENLKDGSVRIFAQGSSGALDEFASLIQKAPEPIIVEKVESKRSKVIPSKKSFQIKTGPMAVELQEGFRGMETQFRDYTNEFRD